MKSEDERLQQLILDKSFADLTQDEKEFVIGMTGSEEDYNALRLVEEQLLQTSKVAQPDVPPSMLAALQSELKMRRQPPSSRWNIFQWKVPAYAAAMAVVFVAFLTRLLVTPAQGIAPMITERTLIDTVFVTRIDTVLQREIVYRPVIKLVTLPTRDSISGTPSGTPSVGVSMKEKEEWIKLLVSGTEE